MRIERKTIFLGIEWQKYLPFVALLSVILSIYCIASYHRLNLDYIPLNGAFQTFNPVRRILLGQIPGREFNPYLGLGPTYLNAFFTFLTGRDFASSQFSIYSIALSLHFLVLWTLFFCSGLTKYSSLIWASFVMTIVSFLFENSHLINEIVGPGTSNLNVRSSLPFLTSLILLVLLLSFSHSWLLYLGIGGLMGMQPLWSNDYGIPSTFNLIFLTIIYAITQDRKRRLRKIFLTILSAATTFYIMGMLLTQGHLPEWLKSNFSGVVGDQFWYYVWFENYNKILAPQDFLKHPLFLGFSCIYLVSIIIIILRGYFKTYTIQHLLLIYLSLTVYTAGILSSVGGTMSVRYFLLSGIVSLFTIPLSIYLLFHGKIQRFLARINIHFIFRQASLFMMLIFVIAPLIHVINYYIYYPIPSPEKGFIKVAELGGWLSPKWKSSIEIAKTLKQELQNKPSLQKILSTYSTGMDVIIGALNPTGTDYIIHALGDKSRYQYLSNWEQFKPEYITTLREDAYLWETWVRRTNWWFYREFIKDYQLVEATFYNLIWQRLEQPKHLNSLPIICQIIQEKNDVVKLIINTPQSVNKEEHNIYYADITLNYYLTVKPTSIPLIGNRGLVNIIERKTDHQKSIGKKGNYSYGAPSSHSNWHISLEHQKGTESILEMKAYPEERAKLTVKSCQAQLLISLNDFALTRQILPSNINNLDWKNGIFSNSQHPDQTGVMIDDKTILSNLYPKMNLDFSGSGSRQILQIQDNQVWVSGSPLDPKTDGYPHIIKVKLR
jgi:hypothetical protein